MAKLDYPIYLFKEGTNSEAYELFKPTYVLKAGTKCWRFRCWAPNAKSVSVVGDFNGWNRDINQMYKIDSDIWEIYIEGLKRFDIYKFSVEQVNGNIVNKADPFALHTETPPANASKIYDIGGYEWQDAEYQNSKGGDLRKKPINIYELHLGSWGRHQDGNYYSYRDMAEIIVDYVKSMGYTHIEILPVTEYPLEGSWGYQSTGFFAPTSRFGTPHDFMYFIDKCHQAGIGVILDLVLSHFPKDEFGLFNFDGTPLYEYADPLKSEHKSWGTMVFDYSSGGVRSFLYSVACFWIEMYHIDGIRLDAVASMLYLDYDREQGEWRPNEKGGNYNLEAISFLQTLNKTVLNKYPHTIMIAEESTAFPMVTMPPSIGGLGFNFKWNMGWMNDVLEYVGIDPFFRKGAHNKLTFGITYAFSENYILPFSHDEVVHGKCSMIGKMPGKYADKFESLKSVYSFMIAHPGKKLNFMGNEIAQFIEWDFTRPIDWFLLDYDTHKGLHEYVKALNFLYRDNSELYELDCEYDGFKWIVVDDNIQNIVSFYRANSNGDKIVAIINFSDMDRQNYKFGVPDAGRYDVILNSKDPKFGGKTKVKSFYRTKKEASHGFKNSLSINLEGNGSLFLKLRKLTKN